LFLEKHEPVTQIDKNNFYKHSILKESNSFFDSNIKTSKLEEVVKKINAKVLDEFSFYDLTNEGEPIEVFNTESGSFIFDRSELAKLSEQLIIYGNSFCKVNIVDGKFDFNFIEPFKVFENELFTDVVFSKKGKILIERRFENEIQILKESASSGKLEVISKNVHNTENKLIFKIDMGDSVITNGSIEMILMQSKLFTTLNHEVESTKTKIFMDQTYLKFYNSIREHFVPVASPEMIEENNSRPIFEALQSNLKSDDLKKANEILENQIATNLMLDKSTLGLSSVTATELNMSTSQTCDTINILKSKVENAITLFICELLNSDDYFIKIKDYSIKNEKENITLTSQLLQVGAITELSAVKKLNPEWSLLEQKIEAYSLMYQKGTPFTEKQRIEAVELGILQSSNIEGGGEDGAIL
jgi:hypothetical protein